MKTKHKLPELCAIQYGYAFDSSNFTEDDSYPPLIRIRDVQRGYSETYYSGEYSNDYVIHAGDLLIGMDGEFNIARWSSQNALLNQRVCKVVVKDEVNEEYIRFALSKKLKDIESRTSFVTVKHLSAKELNKLELDVPDKREQDKIANSLADIEMIQRKYERQKSSMDKLVKARFVEMFGDVIINERNWNCKSWNEVLTIVNGRNQKNVEDKNGKYLICGSGGPMSRATDYLTNEDSVIIGRKGNINDPILMREKYWNVDTAFGLEPHTDFINVEYLYMYCVLFDFEKLNKAVTIPSLTKTDLLKIIMPVPDRYLQKQFAEFIAQVDKSKFIV